MTTVRQQRVSELLYQELSILVGSELEDPALGMVDVSEVVASRDLRSAKVYVSHKDDEVSRADVVKALGRATPYLRGQIAERCSFRVVPELYFSYDDTPEKAARIGELLQQIAAEREENSFDESTEPTASETVETVVDVKEHE